MEEGKSLIVYTRGKRKKDPLDGSSPKRICAPTDDSSYDLLPGKAHDLDRPPQGQTARQINLVSYGHVVSGAIISYPKKEADFDKKEADFDSESYSDVGSDSSGVPVTVSDRESESDAESQSESDAESQSQSESDAESQSQSEVDAESQSESEEESAADTYNGDCITYNDAADAAAAADVCRFRRLRANPSVRMRKPSPEEWGEYCKQIRASRGFDVDFCFRIHMFFGDVIRPSGPPSDKSKIKHYEYLMGLAEKHVYSQCKFHLEDLQLVKVTYQGSGRASYNYITFIAKGSWDKVVRCYQAKVCRMYVYKRNCVYEDKVEVVWLRDERGHLTAEDVSKQEQCCGVDSLSQLYMDEFCPIQPVSRDKKKKLCRAKFKYFMQLAADKASEDLDLGGKKLQCLKLEEAYEQLFGCNAHYYITFEGSLDGECSRFYEAKVILTYNDESDCRNYKVESVWQKDDPSHLTVEERIKNRKEKEARKCFDGDFYLKTNRWNFNGAITRQDTSKDVTYKSLMEKIVAEAKASNSVGQEKLEDLKIEKVNIQRYHITSHYYITFTAKDGECRRRYRARVTRGPYFESLSHVKGERNLEQHDLLEDTVEFVSLEDDDGGQVTAATLSE